MYTIVGVTTNKGIFKETKREWTNYTVHCICTPDKEVRNLIGSTVKDIKVPERVFDNFSNEVGNNVIGQKVAFDFEIKFFNNTEKLVCTDIIPLE